MAKKINDKKEMKVAEDSGAYKEKVDFKEVLAETALLMKKAQEHLEKTEAESI